MKKVKQVNGLVIAEERTDLYRSGVWHFIFLADEWKMGEGFRYAEHDAETLEEAIEWAKDYK